MAKPTVQPKPAVDPQSRGAAHRLDIRLGLTTLWWLTEERPADLGPPVYFDDEGESDPSEPRPPGKKPYSGTTNMRAMADAHAYGYHLRAAKDKAHEISIIAARRYRNRLLDHLRAQVRPGTSKWSGLMGDEQASPGIHGSYHTNAVAVEHLVASLSGDREVLDAANAWFANYHALAERCHTSNGEVVLPGLNWRRRPSKQPLWSAIYREHDRLYYPHDKGPAKAAANLPEPKLREWIRRDTTSLALFIGLIERRRGIPSLLDVPAAPFNKVALRWPMTVHGEPGNYTATMIPTEDFKRLWARGMWRKWCCREVTVTGAAWSAKVGE